MINEEDAILYGYIIDDSNEIVKKFITPFLKNLIIDPDDVYVSGVDENGDDYVDIPEGDICTWHILKKWLVPLYRIGGVIYDK